MDKRELLQIYQKELERELNTLVEAAFEAHEAATNEESKPENKYDTRGLEASYLAGAQAKRASELRIFINQLSKIEIKAFSKETPIQVTALIQLIENAQETKWVFLVPKEGGAKIDFDNKSILIVSPESPLGRELWQRKQGDEFDFEIKNQVKEMEILSVQ